MQKILRYLWYIIRTKYLVGVFVVAFRDNEVLLINKKLGLTRGWEIPGGGKDRGFSPVEAAKKEFFEETGLQANELKLVGITSNEGHRDIHVLYWTNDFSGEIEVQDTFEIADAKFFPTSEALRMLEEPHLGFVWRSLTCYLSKNNEVKTP